MNEYLDFENKNLVVLVPGLPGWGLTDHYYWDSLTFDSHWVNEINTKLILVQPGPMSSHHDRACEIFAQLMGLQTDFGEEHSKMFEHNRLGRDFTKHRNINRVWNEFNPITFICHSTGTNTVRYLQFLLQQDFWNLNTSAKWIKTIVSLNGNINGTQFMHFFEISPVNGVAAKDVLLKSTRQVYNGAVWAVNRKKNLTEDQKNAVVEWNLHHWNIDTRNKKWLIKNSSETKFLSNIDNLFYDLTVNGCLKLNELIGGGYDSTYYFSFYGRATDFDSHIQLSHMLNPLLFRSATYVMHHSFTSGPLTDPQYKSSEWRNNDGMYSIACQKYPLNTATSVDNQELQDFFQPSDQWKRQVWYYSDLQSKLTNCRTVVDHFSMIWARNFLKHHKFQVTSEQQKDFYQNLLTFLSKLPNHFTTIL